MNPIDELREMLINANIVNIRGKDEKPFTLKSGRKSRIFFNVKEAILNPYILNKVVECAGTLFIDYETLVIGSVAVGGIPIGTAVSLKYNRPHIIVRSERHNRGLETKVIGDCKDQTVILFEDVVTSGVSIVSAVEAIREAGGFCFGCIVILDREEGGQEFCAKNKISIVSLVRKSDFGVE